MRNLADTEWTTLWVSACDENNKADLAASFIDHHVPGGMLIGAEDTSVIPDHPAIQRCSLAPSSLYGRLMRAKRRPELGFARMVATLEHVLEQRAELVVWLDPSCRFTSAPTATELLVCFGTKAVFYLGDSHNRVDPVVFGMHSWRDGLELATTLVECGRRSLLNTDTYRDASHCLQTLLRDRRGGRHNLSKTGSDDSQLLESSQLSKFLTRVPSRKGRSAA